jgi:AraC-like DNA-binding protein
LEENSKILTVQDAAEASGVSVRTLQRLFRHYVGVTPKWLIRRYRLKEAAARIEAGEHENWADLARKLGYYDQSHLINDFRRMLGQTPALYSQAKT